MLTGCIIGSEENPSTKKHRLFAVRADGGPKSWMSDEGDDCITPSWGYNGAPHVFVKIGADNVPLITIGDQAIAPGLHPAYSPDGKRIIFTTLPRGKSRREIAVMDFDGGNLEVLTQTTVAGRKGVIESIYGTFSPDGTRIAYASSQGGSLQIWTMGADGKDKRQLTGRDRRQPDYALDANAPSWLRDGSRLVCFGGEEGERGTIYIHDGVKYQSLLTTDPTSNADNPAGSPDGEWVCFESDRITPGETSDPRTHRSRTWAIRPDGTGLRILYPFPYGAGRLPWI